MTLKQKLTLLFTVLVLTAALVLLVFFVKRPEKTPRGTLVYREQQLSIPEAKRICRFWRTAWHSR